MKIIQGATNEVKNFIFSGSYYNKISGSIGKVYGFSGPEDPISGFPVPWDAYLKSNQIEQNQSQVVAVGKRAKAACPPTQDRTGVLYFSNNLNIIGACHGIGSDSRSFYNGFNYYQAFYPMGYFSPPFGENISIFKANLDGYDSLINGSCNNFTVTEYNETFGINSKTASDADLLSSTLTPNIYAPIYSPKETCPPELVTSSYYDEVQFTQIPGTTLALGGNSTFNSNPIPTSLDNFSIRVNGRYATVKDETTTYVMFTGARPIPSYSISNEENKLNNKLCLASLMETKCSLGKGTNGVQLIETADALFAGIGDQVSFAGSDPFYYWHFLFKENAATLPFSNNFLLANDSTVVRTRYLGEGTQLFLPILSSDEYYWKNRQCPDTVDYLPWTFGASIYACPSEHFDIPYYAAIKKFGFYGTRFLNTCKALNLDYELSGVENASELPTGNSNLALEEGTLEPDEIDKDGTFSFAHYNNLLKTAKAEERYSNMYALNQGFFLWANSGEIISGNDYAVLSGTNAAFAPQFLYLINKFQKVFESGLLSFTGNEPNIILNNSDGIFTLISSGTYSNILSTNDEFLSFKLKLSEILTGNNYVNWGNIEKQYSRYVAKSGDINEDFYRAITSGREKRLSTRYFENVLRGNPIDLFPLNSISFSYDSAKDYIEHTGWGRRETSLGKTSNLPEINRRYFEGAYGKASSAGSIIDALSGFSEKNYDYYYPGFFNDTKIGRDLPQPSYIKATGGFIVDSSGRSFSPSGWLAIGYNEVGALDGNFSCFTPLYIQQPLPKVFCKIGQKPTFRAAAVDYHTLPEDKISRKYPEIIFWASKLKMLDCDGRYLYPLKYKWYRIPIQDYNQYLPSGNFFNFASESSITGDWGCLEGNGPECTMFHPQESYPIYTGTTPERDYTFIKGAKNDIDDQYYYICLTSGRFGIRMSNPSQLKIEDWVRFDISVKNGLNMGGSVSIDFETTDYNGDEQTISFPQITEIPNYGGYQQETNTAPETIVEEKIPPPNAGWGDVKAFRFIGPIGYIGATRSYKPSTLKDTRGLREVWGHLLDYGQLTVFYKELTQTEGDLIYGYNHLPSCENYQMPNGKKGVKLNARFNGYKIGHWSLPQQAVASLNNRVGIQWDKLLNLGDLYPPINSRFEQPNFGIGHWQWGNNLGSIKRFGKFSTFADKDIIFAGETSNNIQGNAMIEKVKDKLIGPTDLAGENCGYIKYGIGQNMLYYIEAYERFYILCDPLKKKNVSNKSFLCPGLRIANSALQYFWLGKPTNTYLKRRPMYGPYAYQWRMERHNRDRNGNGISEGSYSMGHGKKYSLLYDAPATYGLYVKNKNNSNYISSLQDLKIKRTNIRNGKGINVLDIRNTWFGERGNEGTSRSYGNVTYSCDPDIGNYDQSVCDYVSIARSVAENINFSEHSCPQDLVAQGECFDPCLSMRYGQGFFPGGKSSDLIGNNSSFDLNSNDDKNIKIVPIAKLKENQIHIGDEEIEDNDRLLFRNPLNTPHARINLAQNEFIGGISPCQDGGSEHCNFTTPTIHIGYANYLIGNSSMFNDIKSFIANIYGDYNIGVTA